MAKIVISYRRSDSAAIAGRIRDRLAAEYGDASIFMDIENIPFGEDFRTHIRDTLLHSDVLLAIVGPEWLGHSKGAAARIMNDVDPVRIEIETTLQARIPTIPVLINGARMPDAAELPDRLKDFAFLNAADVDSGRDFHQHMDRLIEAINGIVARKTGKAPARIAKRAPAAAAARNTNWLPIAAALVFLLAGGAGGAYWFMQRAPAGTPMQAAAPPPLPVVASAAPPPPAASAQPATPPAPAATPAPAPTTTTTAALPAANAPASAARCDQLSPVFADDFRSEKARWVRLGETRLGSNAYYEDGKMVLLAATQNTKWIVLPDQRYGNVTICADVKSPPEAGDLGLTAGGLIFWSRPGNMDDIYSASIYPDGSYAIHRKNDGQWSTVASKRKFASVRPGLDAENQIQLSLNDRRATLYINGVKAQDFDGEPPSGGGVVGLFSRSERDQQNEWRFSKIIVAQ